MNVWVGPVVHKSILKFTCAVFSPPPHGVMSVIWTSGYFLNKRYA